MFDYLDFISVSTARVMYPETPIDNASGRIISGVKNLREGLDPDVLAYWYKISTNLSLLVVGTIIVTSILMSVFAAKREKQAFKPPRK